MSDILDNFFNISRFRDRTLNVNSTRLEIFANKRREEIYQYLGNKSDIFRYRENLNHERLNSALSFANDQTRTYTTTHRIIIPVGLIRILIIVLGIVVVSVIRYCCWLCKRKQTINTLRNPRPASVTPPQAHSAIDNNTLPYQRPYPTSNNNTLSNNATIIRPIIGGRRSSAHNVQNSASVFSLGAGPRPTQLNSSAYTDRNHMLYTDEENDHLSETLVQRDRYGLNSMASTPMVQAYPWGRGVVVPGVGARIGRDSTGGGLTEDERLELGIRAIGGNTELNRDLPRRDRTVSNNSTDNGDLALLTHLMALDIIYHSDNNHTAGNNPSAIEKPPDYEQCLQELASNIKLVDISGNIQPPTYEDICRNENGPVLIPPASTIASGEQFQSTVNKDDSVNRNDTVIYMVDTTGNVTSVTDANCQTQNVNIPV